MRIGRLFLTSLAIFVIALVWNGVLHMVLLREADALVAPLRRPHPEDYLLLSLLLTYGIAFVFTLGYSRYARSGRIAEGLRYGLFFGVVAGLLVDLNQYVLYPLPARVVLYWFIGGLLEFTLYGLVAAKLYGPPRTMFGR